MTQTLIDITITLVDSELNEEKLHEFALNLRTDLESARIVQQADLIPVETAPKGAKSIGGFVTGSLKAIAELTQLKPIITGLGDRLFGQTIEIEVEKQFLRGKKLKIKLQHPEDLAKVMPELEKFMKG